MKKLREFLGGGGQVTVEELDKVSYDDKTLILEISYSRLYNHTKERNIGIVSAYRAERSADENGAAHSALGDDIRKHGMGYVNLQGRYIENRGTPQERKVTEPSYLVIGKKGHDNGAMKGFLKTHGEKYGQESVLYKAHDSANASLINTRETSNGPKGATTDLGPWHPNRTGDYASQMNHGKKSFVFGEALYLTGPTFLMRREVIF